MTKLFGWNRYLIDLAADKRGIPCLIGETAILYSRQAQGEDESESKGSAGPARFDHDTKLHAFRVR